MDSNEDFDQIYAAKSGLDGDDDDYSGMLGSGGKRKKSSKNQTRTDKSFFLKFIIAILIVEAYFAYNYGMMIEYNT